MKTVHDEMREKAERSVQFNRFTKVNRFCGMTSTEYRARLADGGPYDVGDYPPQCWPCCDKRKRDAAGLVEGSRFRCDTCPVHPSRIDEVPS